MKSPDLPLFKYLKSKSPVYYGKALELREAVTGWLNYIPQSFPHYTRHTIEHSDEILAQLSKLLLIDGKPIVRINAVETYILIAAAYLHDSGMVVSDKEKQEILKSAEWKEWTIGSGGGAGRFREIQKLHVEPNTADALEKQFITDIQLRHLIAEFVRRVHHLRAKSVITQHEARLARFAFGDDELARAVSDVCVSHGLAARELDDSYRYPYARDIRGEDVNLRFLAILLRIGDLLDVAQDRACPLLLNPACPLPYDSLAHWTKHQRFTHRSVRSDQIEFTAECENQEEHRLLQDWFQWLEDELRNAATIMARPGGRYTWAPPRLTLNGPNPTVQIRPSKTASYIPSRWAFEIDQEIIFRRLIFDVYSNADAFLRELIQNSLDATRCQLYLDLGIKGVSPKESPTSVEEGVRDRYPLKIALEEISVKNKLSGELEKRQALTIHDCGLGMDEEVIKKYFLQVGRSFYTTEEFSRNFAFTPTSRFGVGFLSVFAASEEVVVETFKPSSKHSAQPIKLTLTGPRNYLLLEHGSLPNAGTKIRVILRNAWHPGHLTNLVREWCPRVEFPILVSDLGNVSTICRELSSQFTTETPDITSPGAKFSIRAFPISRTGIEGELYVLTRTDQHGESWNVWYYANYLYPKKHPSAKAPSVPGSLQCLHGIRLGWGGRHDYSPDGPRSARIDYRGNNVRPTLARNASHDSFDNNRKIADIIDGRWVELLKEHLSSSGFSKGKDAWRYLQGLIRHYPFQSFWLNYPGTIPFFRKGIFTPLSLKEALSLRVISIVAHNHERDERSLRTLEWVMEVAALESLSDLHRKELFLGRNLTSVRLLAKTCLVVDWRSGSIIKSANIDQTISIANLHDSKKIGFGLHKTSDNIYSTCVLNRKNPFVKWLLRVHAATIKNHSAVPRDGFTRILSLLMTPLRFRGHEFEDLQKFVDAWRSIPGLPKNLVPPSSSLADDMFTPYCIARGWGPYRL